MMDVDWKALVKTVAPGIASVFGTPLAGMGVTALLNVLLPDGTPTPANPEAFLAQTLATANPDMLLKMKQADQQFALDMERAGFNLEELRVRDRESARARETAVKDSTPKILAYMLTGGFFGMLAMMMLHPIPTESKDALNIMLGSLGTAWVGAMTYYHGSSMVEAGRALFSKPKP